MVIPQSRKMQETLTHSSLPPQQEDADNHRCHGYHGGGGFMVGSSTSTPFVSAPSSPRRGLLHSFSLGSHHGSPPPKAPPAAEEEQASLMMMLQEEEDLQQQQPLSYTRRAEFYACAIPFSWEERPGTPKASSKGGGGGFDDHHLDPPTAGASVAGDAETRPLSSPSSISAASAAGSEFEFNRGSEFEFNSTRFSDANDAPPSPAPLHSSAANDADADADLPPWRPLRLPPRLQLGFTSGGEKTSSPPHIKGCTSTLSAPVSPSSAALSSPIRRRGPGLRRVLCGISDPSEATPFDPFAVAIEEMTKQEDCASKKAHHRRALSSSPLRIFHWDDLSPKALGGSHGSLGSGCETGLWNDSLEQKEEEERKEAPQSMVPKKSMFRGLLNRKRGSRASSCSSFGELSDLRSSGRSSTSQFSSDSSSIGDACGKAKATSPSSTATSPSAPSVKQAANDPFAIHHSIQRELTRKRSFLPLRHGLLNCFRLSSKRYAGTAFVVMSKTDAS